MIRDEAVRQIAYLKGAIETPILRARQGWAPRDVWALDHQLCRVLAGMLNHVATAGHDWPESEEFPTYTDFINAVKARPDALGDSHPGAAPTPSAPAPVPAAVASRDKKAAGG